MAAAACTCRRCCSARPRHRGLARGASDGPAFSRALDDARSAPNRCISFSCCRRRRGRPDSRAFSEITSVTARRQLRWIAWGTALGVGPSRFGYALPWALGVDPPLAMQLTAIPLGLVPLAFASAIVRYRLRDVEVIIKRGAGLHRVPRRRARRSTSRCSKLAGVRLRQRRATSTTGSSRLLATIVVVLLAQPVEEGRSERARSGVLSRSLRLSPRAGRLRARSEQRSRRHAAGPAAGVARRRNAASWIGWR